MPAMELQTDATIYSAYKPYLDCYARTIESGPGSRLTDDGEAREALQRAAEHCAASKQIGTDLAASHLTSSKPEMSERQRNNILTRYRRQQGVFALINRYRERGRSHLLQAYFARIGRAGRENRTFVMLSAE
jgi:transposase